MKTRARTIKAKDVSQLSHGNENTNEVLSPPGKDRDRTPMGGFNKSSRRNGITNNNPRIEHNFLSSRENSIIPSPDPAMTRDYQNNIGTDEQHQRMALITKALSTFSGAADELFKIDCWKGLIKNAVAGNHLTERKYRLDDRLTNLAHVIIEQITSISFRQSVFHILSSSRGKNIKIDRAQQFLNLCDGYEKSKSDKTWRNAIGEGGDTDDSMNSSPDGDSSKDQSGNGWLTDEGEKYNGPILSTNELCKLDSSSEMGEDFMDVEKENNTKKTKRVTRRGYNSQSFPLGSNETLNHRISPVSRDFKEKDFGSFRCNLPRQCKVTLSPLIRDDRLAEELNLGRPPIVERLTLNEQRGIEKTGPIFSLGNDDEYIENETPPSTPLDGTSADIRSDSAPPSKRKKCNPKENKEILPNGIDRVRDEPVLKVTPVRGYQAVGNMDMVERYNGNFDYLALVDDPDLPNGKDDDSDPPDLSPPPEQKDNKENFPKSEQDIASYYPKPLLAPELKPYMFEEMQEALSKPRKDKIVSAFQLTIKQEHLAVYNKSEWLEDVNIDFYLELIKDRNNKPDSGYPKVYIFHSFFYKLLEKKGYEAVRGGTGAEDIFKFDLVLIPIHSHHHWVLVAVNFRDRTMTCYDSMDHNNNDQLDIIGRFLVQEYIENQRLRGSTPRESGSVSESDDVETFSMSNAGSGDLGPEWKVTDKGAGQIPQQTNGRDCGVFCLQFAEYLSRRHDFDFEQRHTAYFRKRMLYETLKKTLLIQ